MNEANQVQLGAMLVVAFGRVADALDRIAAALEREDERIEIKGDIADTIQDIKPTVTPFMLGVSDIPEHRLKDTVYLNARDGGLAYDRYDVRTHAAERRHTIPEGYKRLPKAESCPDMWTESDGARYCPHGPVDTKTVVLHHDLLQDRWVDANSGHSWRSSRYGKPGPQFS